MFFFQAYLHDSSSSYMPETRFRFLTFVIVSISLIMGILIPNIEFVLGIVGATIGVMICLIFPATFFISISSKNTNERLLAQVIIIIINFLKNNFVFKPFFLLYSYFSLFIYKFYYKLVQSLQLP